MTDSRDEIFELHLCRLAVILPQRQALLCLVSEVTSDLAKGLLPLIQAE